MLFVGVQRVLSNFPISEITENNPLILKLKICFKTGSETMNPEELASAMIAIVQSINESKNTDSYVEPLIKAITDMVKDVDDS